MDKRLQVGKCIAIWVAFILLVRIKKPATSVVAMIVLWAALHLFSYPSMHLIKAIPISTGTDEDSSGPQLARSQETSWGRDRRFSNHFSTGNVFIPSRKSHRWILTLTRRWILRSIISNNFSRSNTRPHPSVNLHDICLHTLHRLPHRSPIHQFLPHPLPHLSVYGILHGHVGHRYVTCVLSRERYFGT